VQQQFPSDAMPGHDGSFCGARKLIFDDRVQLRRCAPRGDPCGKAGHGVQHQQDRQPRTLAREAVFEADAEAVRLEVAEEKQGSECHFFVRGFIAICLSREPAVVACTQR
jgi:hypothetical protein